MDEKLYIGLYDIENVPDGYDRYLWAGRGCVKGIKWCVDNKKQYKVMENNWEYAQCFEDAIIYLEEVREWLVSELRRVLNPYLDVDYNISGWKVLLYSWLEAYLSSYYDKYITLKRIKQDYGWGDCFLCNNIDRSPTLDYVDFVVQQEKDEFNASQFLQLIYRMDQIKCCTEDYGSGPQENRVFHNIGTRSSVKQLLLKKMRKSLLNNKRRVHTVLISNDIECGNLFSLGIFLISSGRIVTIQPSNNEGRSLIENTSIDWEFRKRKLISKTGDEFRDIIADVVLQEVPIAYIEGHSRLKEYVASNYKEELQAENVVYAYSSVSNNEIAKVFCANMRMTEACLCAVQHGGGYGTDRTWKLMDDYRLADRYITWGWSLGNKYGCRFIVLPSFKLKRYLSFCDNESKRNKGNVLFVSYSYPRYFYRFDRSWIKYYNNIGCEGQFFNNIDCEIKNHIIVRLYQYDYGWRTQENLAICQGNVKFDRNKEFSISIRHSRFVILTEWSTTVLEVLFCDIPFVVLKDKRNIEEEAQNDIESLQKVGIICDDWETLAKRVNSIYPHVEEWWNDEERQRTVQRVRRKYAFCSRDLYKIWYDFLTSL